MDTQTLQRALKALNKDKKFTIGVYASDTLPRKSRKPIAIISNNEPKNMPGMHWQAIYVPKRGKGEFFCSYGTKPYVQGHLKFLKNNCKTYISNSKMIQALDSKVCGKYCLLYLNARMRGQTLKQFLSKFSDNLQNNDVMCDEMGDYLLRCINIRSAKT
jgi:hypothetical protein